MFLFLLAIELFAVGSVRSQPLSAAETARLVGRCMIWVETNQGNTTSDAYAYCSQFTKKIIDFFGSHKRGPTDEVPEKDLSGLISQLIGIKPNKAPLLWSGAYAESQVAASRFGQYASLEATLLGYCMDGWDICANLTEAQRPPWNHCRLLRQFWSKASEQFASGTTGIVTVLVNASRRPILRENSIFANKEVQMLQSGNVKRLDLHLLDPYKIQKSDPCDLPELDKVKRTLLLNKIPLTCSVNSGLASRVACIVDATRPLCNRALTTWNASLLATALRLLLFTFLVSTSLL